MIDRLVTGINPGVVLFIILFLITVSPGISYACKNGRGYISFKKEETPANPDSLEYIIESFDFEKKKAVVRVNLPIDIVNQFEDPDNFAIFKDTGIKITNREAFGENDSAYTVDFSDINKEQLFYVFYPIWGKDWVFLPGWSIIFAPENYDADIIIRTKQGRVISPDQYDVNTVHNIFYISGYLKETIKVGDKTIELFNPNEKETAYLKEVVPVVLEAHFNTFTAEFPDHYAMVFNSQDPVRKNPYGAGISMQKYQYYPKYIIPPTNADRLEFLDILEHEICHWFIETSEPMGHFMVEGFNIYVTLRILCDNDVITGEEFEFLLKKRYDNMLKNSLYKTVSVREAEGKYGEDEDYISLLYSKAALVSFLLDQKVDIKKIAVTLSDRFVSKGDMFSEEDFMSLLGKHKEYYLELVNSKDITPELLEYPWFSEQKGRY